MPAGFYACEQSTGYYGLNRILVQVTRFDQSYSSILALANKHESNGDVNTSIACGVALPHLSGLGRDASGYPGMFATTLVNEPETANLTQISTGVFLLT